MPESNPFKLLPNGGPRFTLKTWVGVIWGIALLIFSYLVPQIQKIQAASPDLQTALVQIKENQRVLEKIKLQNGNLTWRLRDMERRFGYDCGSSEDTNGSCYPWQQAGQPMYGQPEKRQ